MKSYISEKEISAHEAIQISNIRQGVYELILTDYPSILKENYISIDELNLYRRLYLKKLIEQENSELAEIDKDVIRAMETNSVMSENIQDESPSKLTNGQKLADSIAFFGGSWTFIIIFFTFIIIWIVINIRALFFKPFDPYPFILLNLILSCLASIQAPIIMMSQNRQEQKDRTRAEHDYKINLKAELEIKLLSEKIDHLLIQQNKKLLEIQSVQVDYLDDIVNQVNSKK
jgi:uncharacterized membrane protein